jgi:hypothetical protein
MFCTLFCWQYFDICSISWSQSDVGFETQESMSLASVLTVSGFCALNGEGWSARWFRNGNPMKKKTKADEAARMMAVIIPPFLFIV